MWRKDIFFLILCFVFYLRACGEDMQQTAGWESNLRPLQRDSTLHIMYLCFKFLEQVASFSEVRHRWWTTGLTNPLYSRFCVGGAECVWGQDPVSSPVRFLSNKLGKWLFYKSDFVLGRMFMLKITAFSQTGETLLSKILMHPAASLLFLLLEPSVTALNLKSPKLYEQGDSSNHITAAARWDSLPCVKCPLQNQTESYSLLTWG